MKNALSITAIFISVFLLSSFKSKAEKDTVRVGIYITSIHNIDFKDMEYSITFWLWLKYKNKTLDFLHTLEIPNAKEYHYEFVDIDSSNDKISALMKVQCVMKDVWRIRKFPFDKQKLWLTIENSKYDTRFLLFERDIPAGKICDKRIRFALGDWAVDSCTTEIDTSAYETAFNDETIKIPHSDYSAFKVRLFISRHTAGLLFWKLFIGMYIAFLIAILCFYIRPDNYDSRFQLSVGSLFATIGNKYIVESSLPESTTFTLVDSLHGLTLFFILLTIAGTICSLIIKSGKRPSAAIKFDKIAPLTLFIVYFSCNLYLILRSHSG